MSKLIGTGPNQVPSNADLGDLAFQDSDFPTVKHLRATGSLIIGDESTAASGVLSRNLTVPEGSSGDLFLFGPSPEIGFFDANANRASAIDGNDGHIKFFSNVGSGTGGADAIVDGTEKATSGTNSLQTIQFNRIARDGITGLYSSGGDIDILLGELRMGGSTVIRDADTIGLAHDGTQLDTANLIIGNDDTDNNTVNYGMKIIRHGNGGAGGAGTWSNSTSAISIADTAAQGPSSTETTAGIFTISMGRMSPADTDAEKGSIINVTYDGTIGPMRLDGKGNLFVGWDRGNAWTNTNSFQVIAYGGLITGSSQTYQQADANGGALIAGSVGIGTTAPQSTLDVVSTTDLGSVFRKDFSGAVGSSTSKLAAVLWGEDHDNITDGQGVQSSLGPMLGFGARLDNAAPNTGDVRAGIAYSYNGDLSFHAKAAATVVDGSNERMRIDGQDGYVGINTSAPAYRLDVGGGIRGTDQGPHQYSNMYYCYWNNNYATFTGTRNWQILRYASWYWGTGGFTMKVYKYGPYSYEYAEYFIRGHTRTGYGPSVSKHIVTQYGSFDPITVGSIVAINGDYGYSEITINDTQYNQYIVEITSPVLIQRTDNTPSANSIYVFGNNSYYV